MLTKQHLEFHAVELSGAHWHVPPGYPPGIEQRILAGALDEEGRAGTRTRLLRFAPGAFTTQPFVHTYWEEVYLMAGDLLVGAEGVREAFGPNTYACRPPGVVHGPFASSGGCLLLEYHYFAS